MALQSVIAVDNGRVISGGNAGGGGSSTAVVIATTSLSADVGKLVRMTSTLTAQIYEQVFTASQELRFDLPGADKYTVELISGTGAEEVVEYSGEFIANCGCYYDVRVGWSKTTFRGIQEILNAHKETEVLAVGDEIEITLGGNIPMIYRIAAINHEVAYPHQVIFEPKWCLPTTRPMNSSNTNAGGWNVTALRAWLNGEFLTSYITDDLRPLIKNRDILISQGGQSSNLQTATDKIWLPREYEIFGATTYAAATEHTSGNAEMFPIYSTSSNRIKTAGQSGAAVGWWECSPGVSYSTSFCGVNAGGAAGSPGASNSYGVAGCFHLLADS